MSRALLVLLVLAVLTAPAFAQSIARGRRGSHQGTTRGSRGAKRSDDSCAVSGAVATRNFQVGGEPVRPVRLNEIDGEPVLVPDHPMTLASAKAYVENQPAPLLLDHYTTTYDCVDSR